MLQISHKHIIFFGLSLLTIISFGLQAQKVTLYSADLKWNMTGDPVPEGAMPNEEGLYTLSASADVESPAQNIHLKVLETEVVALSDEAVDGLTDQFLLNAEIYYHRKRPVLVYDLIPYRIIEGNLAELVLRYEIVGVRSQTNDLQRDPPVFAENSNLRNGDIYKIAVEQTGIHKINRSFLEELGIDVNNIDPDRINIYGNGSGPLPERLSASRLDDVQPVDIYIKGGDDGSFDADDALYFYAVGPHRWSWNEEDQMYLRKTNVYSLTSNYFIKIEENSDQAHRIRDYEGPSEAEDQITQFLDYMTHEREERNLLADYSSTHGSGQDWYGEWFKSERTMDFSDAFIFPNAVRDLEAAISMSFAGRSDRLSRVFLNAQGEEYSRSITAARTSDGEATYAFIGEIQGSFPVVQDKMNISVTYPQLSSASISEGWLDYITVNAFRELILEGEQMAFRNRLTENNVAYEYQLRGTGSRHLIWDITDRHHAKNVSYSLSGDEARFTAQDTIVHEYIVFDPESSLYTPQALGKIENQNLHAIKTAEAVVVYHPEFEEQAMRLMNHRREHNGMNVIAVDIHQVYNEFGSGMMDPTALRDFCKMIYDRSEEFKSVILVGDGSYDLRGIEKDLPQENYIPIYETAESLAPIFAFPADDYYALLDDNEGVSLKGLLDVGIGRIPCRTPEEAKVVVDKIINYDSSEETKGDWRLRVGYIADDEDNNWHINDAEKMSRITARDHQYFNREKVYLDAFQQESTPGGDRYPGASEALNSMMFKGALFTNYIGHGGPLGWAQERVLKISDIQNWSNRDRLTVMVTATCSFTSFDDAKITSAGEYTLLNPNGGAVGLLSTVRAVFSGSNEQLTTAVFEHAFKLEDGKQPTIGDIILNAKNSITSSSTQRNSRKFVLFGDPTMPLAIPVHNVVTTKINDIERSTFTDTLKSLEEVSVAGEIRDYTGEKLSDYNGVLAVTIFDKPRTIKTLANDERSIEREFDIRKNIVYKGRITIENGEFQFDFTVPKDINLEIGEAKISYYASAEGREDGKGLDLVPLGGTGLVSDNTEGPQVDLYLNSRDFKNGDRVGPNPLLLAFIEDDIGINVTGNSIGHDLTAVLDNNSTARSIILNDFFVPEVDNSAKGSVSYRLENLEEGSHTLRVKAWDIHNNSGEAEINFIVSRDIQLEIEELFNFPNPFTQWTAFGFEHNVEDALFEINVEIYDLSGKQVHTMNSSQFSSEGRVEGIRWEASETPNLLPGMYIYRIEVQANVPGYSDILSTFAQDKLVYIKQ